MKRITTTFVLNQEDTAYIELVSKSADMNRSQFMRWLIAESKRLSLLPTVRCIEKSIETNAEPEVVAN